MELTKKSIDDRHFNADKTHIFERSHRLRDLLHESVAAGYAQLGHECVAPGYAQLGYAQLVSSATGYAQVGVYYARFQNEGLQQVKNILKVR